MYYTGARIPHEIGVFWGIPRLDERQCRPVCDRVARWRRPLDVTVPSLAVIDLRAIVVDQNHVTHRR